MVKSGLYLGSTSGNVAIQVMSRGQTFRGRVYQTEVTTHLKHGTIPEHRRTSE